MIIIANALVDHVAKMRGNTQVKALVKPTWILTPLPPTNPHISCSCPYGHGSMGVFHNVSEARGVAVSPPLQHFTRL